MAMVILDCIALLLKRNYWKKIKSLTVKYIDYLYWMMVCILTNTILKCSVDQIANSMLHNKQMHICVYLALNICWSCVIFSVTGRTTSMITLSSRPFFWTILSETFPDRLKRTSRRYILLQAGIHVWPRKPNDSPTHCLIMLRSNL